MRKDDHRTAGGLSLEIRLKPLKLLRAERPHPFNDSHIGQPYKMNVLVVETVPTSSLGVFAIALQILFAVVGRSVVLSRNEEGLFGFCTFDQLGKGIEFFGLGR